METNSYLSIAKLLLPEVLIDYFILEKYTVEEEELHFYFTEKNQHPEDNLISKGFFPQASIQDFPIRGKAVYLHVTRRRWLSQKTNKIVSRNWSLVAKGTRMTDEFSSFLKEINR